MKSITLLSFILLFCACGSSGSNKDVCHYIVETKVQVKEGRVQDVLKLFSTTNPALVANEKDWIKASFSVVDKKNVVIVRAHWKDKLSYLKFSSTEEYRNSLKQFSGYLEARPEVNISKVLFTM